jgi:small subunit ribosomal protein S3
MGHKVHPTGFRIGVIRDWQAKWYADKHYLEYIQEDIKLREAIQSGYPDTGIAQVEISRQANEVLVNIHTSRPGVIIGRGGQRVDEMRNRLEQVTGKRVRLNILEVHQPELDATLVAKTVAEQIERRIAYRRAMKQAIARTIQAGAKGIRISCAGRLGGAEIARRQIMHDGQVPLHTLRADIDYGFTEARTKLGRIGVKVWIYRGDILPEPKVEAPEEAELEAAEPVAGVSEQEKPVTAEPTAEVSKEEEPVAAEPVAEVSGEEKTEVAEPVADFGEEEEPEVAEPAAEVSEEEGPEVAEAAAEVGEEKESAVEIIGDDVTAEESKIPEDS